MFANFINALGVVIAVFIVIYTYFQWSLQYWQRKGVPILSTISFPFGNVENPFRADRTFGMVLKDFYDQFKCKGAKFGGIYFMNKPSFLPVDPDMVRNILSKDFRCECFIFRKMLSLLQLL